MRTPADDAWLQLIVEARLTSAAAAASTPSAKINREDFMALAGVVWDATRARAEVLEKMYATPEPLPAAKEPGRG